ncbi:MAG: AmmeMemoRadiSam system protein B [Deltaproteobacteria bacterium]|nr:AmmeMemoRadiSam system protein B [Candidatus Zymogenaceae bacterium]
MSKYEYPKIRSVDMFAVDLSGQPGVALRDPHLYAREIIALPRDALAVIQHFTGTNTIEDIRAKLLEQYGGDVPAENIRFIAEELDEHHFLLSERFLRHKRTVDEEFYASRVRHPVHAGSGYSEDPKELVREFDGYFSRAAVDLESLKKNADETVAIVAPHISINAGGPSFAHAYGALVEDEPADLYVILGIGHEGLERFFAGTSKDFITPLGTVETHQEFMSDLNKRYDDALFDGEALHRTEHTIEFQTVFLKYVLKDRRFFIAPILASFPHQVLSSDQFPEVRERIDRFIDALRGAITDFNGRVVLIASVDFAHVGVKYGDDKPLSPEDLEVIQKRDRMMIEILEAGDGERFLDHIASDDDARRICGFSALYVMLRVLEKARGVLLNYDLTSMDEYNSTVTFAGMKFTRRE